MRHLRRRLGETLAITSLYLGIPHPHSRSSLCAFIPQIPQGAWTRSSLGVNSSGPYLGSAEHACQRASAPSSTYGNYPRRGLEPAARNPHPQQGLPATDVQPHYLRLWGQGLRTPVLFVPRYVVLLD